MYPDSYRQGKRDDRRAPQRASQGPQQSQTAPALPANYLRGGYYNESGNLKKEIIIDWPEELANSLSRTNLKMTQLRKFYNRAKAIEQKYRFARDFEGVKSDLYILQRDAQYAFNRGVVPLIFLDFIKRNIEVAVKSPADFKGFVQHYQSLVEYATGTLKEG